MKLVMPLLVFVAIFITALGPVSVVGAVVMGLAGAAAFGVAMVLVEKGKE